MRWPVFIAIILSPAFSFAQSMQKQHWIEFTDKNDTPYALDRPLEFLSQRALDRRERQQIPLTENDLPIDPLYLQAVLNTGADYLTHSKWFNSVSVHVPDSATLNAIQSLPFVRSTEPVGKKEKSNAPIDKFEPLDSDKAVLVDYSESDYGKGFNQIDMLSGVTLHNLGYRGEGMLIAVFDAGFPNVDVYPAFDSLRADGRIVGTWDFVSRDNSIYEDNPHGMSVLSTMAANIPGEFIGTAPKASYLLLRTEEGATEAPIELDYWIAGAEYADSAGADVINSSLGYTTFDNSQYDFTYADMDGNTVRGSIVILATSHGSTSVRLPMAIAYLRSELFRQMVSLPISVPSVLLLMETSNRMYVHRV